jgi:hypothetical protein
VAATRDWKALRQGELPERVPSNDYEILPVALARSEFLSLLDEEAPQFREELKERVAPPLEAALASFDGGPLIVVVEVEVPTAKRMSAIDPPSIVTEEDWYAQRESTRPPLTSATVVCAPGDQQET